MSRALYMIVRPSRWHTSYSNYLTSRRWASSLGSATSVDLRSDTLTKPTPEMKQAMLLGTDGDDVFCEDETTKILQGEIATMFKKEAALYVPSGTMGNLICVLAHCYERGLEVLLGDQSHLVMFEQGGIATIGGVHPLMLRNLPDGTFDLDTLDTYIRPRNDPHQPFTGLIAIENTHNCCGGRAIPLDWMKQLKGKASGYGIPVHLDGARAMNAAVALGVEMSDITQHVDTISFCFSKGVGAPIGSIIAGPKDFIARGVRLRKVLGGGWRQPGMLAAAVRYCLEGARERIVQDHKHAKLMAQELHDHSKGVIKVDVDATETNLVYIDVIKPGVTAQQMCDRLAQVLDKEKSALGTDALPVLGALMAPRQIRFAIYSSISEQQIHSAIAKLKYVISELAA